MDPFDKSRCSFNVPDFTTEEEEREWMWSLTPEQGFELLHLMRIYRWGEEAMRQPMDFSAIRTLTMEEFNRMKRAEDITEDDWRACQGLAKRYTH